MRPRKDIFATTYIQETVDAYASALSLCTLDKNPPKIIKWAHDVLHEYFQITDETNAIIKKAKKHFYKLPIINSDLSSKPYFRNYAKKSFIDYSSLYNLSIQRRSVRWYKQQFVPRELIDKAITVAGLAPSACNRQPFKFLVYDDKDKINEIASIPMGTKGFYHNFPGIIAVVGDLSAYFHERDRHVIYIDASLASMALLYALESQGVSSCVINWPDIPGKENNLKKKLNLKEHERVIMFISYGYPDPNGMVPFSQKKELNKIRSYNHEYRNTKSTIC